MNKEFIFLKFFKRVHPPLLFSYFRYMTAGSPKHRLDFERVVPLCLNPNNELILRNRINITQTAAI